MSVELQSFQSYQAILYIKGETRTRDLIPTQKKKIIGRGDEGYVYPHRINPKLAVKKIAINKGTNLNEHVMGMKLTHKTLVKTVSAFIKCYPKENRKYNTADKYKIVMERQEGEPICKKYRINKSQLVNLDHVTREQILIQAKECCQYLYQQRVSWQDLHDGNMFFTDQEELKLIDFARWTSHSSLTVLTEGLLAGIFQLISTLISLSPPKSNKLEDYGIEKSSKQETEIFGTDLISWYRMKVGQIKAIDDDTQREAFLYNIFDEVIKAFAVYEQKQA